MNFADQAQLKPINAYQVQTTGAALRADGGVVRATT